MIITSGVNHLFEAGSKGTTLMQLEFLPEVFSYFNVKSEGGTAAFIPVTLFSEGNRLIKIVKIVCILRVVLSIVIEL